MASPATVPFTSVDTTAHQPAKDEVESPSISSANALARYEYEAGHANATTGTKILMVEWEDDDTTRGVRGDWHISWDGSTRVLPANDQPANDVNRMYFLLPPGVAVPTSVTLTLRPQDASKAVVVWHTNPLPALFPPELGASARAAGKKGVLHTIWAKKRLQVLQKEIEAESRNNVEGIGLIMVVQEKEWIESTFGVNAKPAGLSISLGEPTSAQIKGPSSPRSPGGGRLMDKLAGLRLGTSEKDLSPSTSTPGFSNPLSPESSDIAISSFAVFKGANPSALAAKPPQQPQAQPGADPPRKVAAQAPPQFITEQQGAGGMGSLNALSGPAPVFQSRSALGPADDEDHEDGLFALPISPRSPEVGKSPFSFAASDTAPFLKEESAA
ncbi:TPR-like protein [Stemphylium lycopersici]|uniref:TPR-like protein n=1 Tax=Stemphylium lycopersici TaxID=183478 RepID=A0A364NF45_STELY|nr:TPR-like protein [Stemphylium lycopersici]RAR15945.1 TPR-like protein [Stemphylium lycopersici]